MLPLCWTDGDGECACGRGHASKGAGKVPLTPHGVKNATTNAELVDYWATKWPNANWGVACTAVTVMDIDDAELAAQLKADAEFIAQHFVVSTPRRGGLHLYLVEENPAQQSRVLSSQDGRRLGELQRGGRYVVGPGSRIAGRQYRALTNNPPAKVEDAEEWLAEMFERYGVVLRRSHQTEIQEWAPIEFEGVDADASLERAIQSLQPERGKRLIAGLQQGGDSEGQSSRSEADFAAVSTLIEAGLTDPEVAAIWMHSPLGQRRKVQRRPDYVARTIANAHAAVEVGKLGSVTSARPTNIMPAPRGNSLVGEAIKTGQLAVEVDLLGAVNFEARLVDKLEKMEAQLAGDGVPDPGTKQSLIAELKKGPRLISAAPGIGKTHQVVQLAEEHDMVVNRPVLHAVPSHKSFANVERHGYWEHWQGHANGEGGGEPCPASVLGNKGYRPGPDCTCGWIRPADDGGHVPTVSPVEYLLADTPDGLPLRPEALEFPLWVFDDIGPDKFVDTMVITRRDLELTAQHHPYQSARALTWALLRVLDGHTAENQGRLIHEKHSWSGSELVEHLDESFAEDGISVDTWEFNTVLDILERVQRKEGMWPDQPWVPRQKGPEQPLPLNFMETLFNCLVRDCGSHFKGIPGNPSVHMVWASPRPGQPQQSIIRVNRRKYLPREAVHKTVVLDASGDPDLWSTALGAPVTPGETNHELLSPEGMPFPESMRVVQLRDSHVGKTTLEHFDGDGQATLIPKYRDLLKGELQARKELGQARRVGIITFRELIPDCIAALQEVGYTYSDNPEQTEIVTGYYYNLRGANEFIGCDVLVLLGYPRPNPQGLYEETCALYQDDPRPISKEPARYSGRLLLRNGHSISIDKPLYGYNDSRLQSMLDHKSQAELYQALHRARPFAPATSVQEVLLVTDVPVPGVPVDTFFGRDGRMFDCLLQLLSEPAHEVTVPQLVEAFMTICGPDGDGATKESLQKWVRNDSTWLAEATGSEFAPGRGKGRPGIFRTRAIPNI